LINYLYEGTFFNQILSILLESYYEFLLAAFLHLKYTNDQRTIGLQPRNLQEDAVSSSFEEIYEDLSEKYSLDLQLSHKEEFGTIFTYITLILLLVVVPALLVKIMFTDQSSLLCEK